MKPPVSPYFTPISLLGAFTVDRQTLPETLRPPP